VIAVLAAAIAVGARPWRRRLASPIPRRGLRPAKLGTAGLCTPPTCLGALQARDVLASEAKVVAAGNSTGTHPALARCRRKGCLHQWRFDLIHPGHVSLLSQARGAADRLIVGLNSDASIKRLKGADRPVQNETARGIVLASMAAVDLVILFEEDTPIELIRAGAPRCAGEGVRIIAPTRW